MSTRTLALIRQTRVQDNATDCQLTRGDDEGTMSFRTRLGWASNLMIVLVLVIGCRNNGLVGDDFTTKVSGTSFFPMSGPRSGGASIVIAGENFRDGITVFFGDVQAQEVTVASTSSLVVTLPPGDFGPTAIKLRLQGSEAVLPQPFRYSASEVVLAFEQDIGRSTYDAAFGSGDFNGDGLTDVVFATDGRLELYLNSASGLEFHSNYNLPPAVELSSLLCFADIRALKYSLAVLDSNADGLPDVVVSVYRTQLLYRFEAQPEGGFAPAVETAHTGVLDECLNRVLAPADLDGDDAIDLIVLNHSADVSNLSSPEEMGTIGVIWDFGTAREETTILEVSLDCTKLHSWSINLAVTPNILRVLCAEVGPDQRQTISEVEISGSGQVLLGTAANVAQDVAEHTRYHFVDFERDNDPEFVFVNRLGESPTDYSYHGGIAERLGDALVTKRSFDLQCDAFEPTLLIAAVIPDQPADALFFCPQGLEVQGLFGDWNEHWIELASDLFSQLLTPGFNSNPDGTPAMPSAHTLDLDSDGWDELIVQRLHGRNLLLYANQRSELPPASRVVLEPTRLGATIAGGHRQWGYPRQSGSNGRPSGPMIDLDGDDIPELVIRTVDLWGGNPAVAIGKWIELAGRFDVHEFELSKEVGVPPQTNLPLLVEDFNGDGQKDVLAPFGVWVESGESTFADIVMSNASGYTTMRRVLLSSRLLSRVQQVGEHLDGSIELVGYTLESSSGSAREHNLVEVISLVVLTGSFEVGFTESDILAENLVIPGGVHALLDLDGDARLDVLSWDGGVCWGDELGTCGTGGPLLLFDGALSPLSLRVVYSKAEERFELFGMGSDERSGTWVTLSGRQVDSVKFPLNPSWTLLQSLWQQGSACDLDGDGRGEIIFQSRPTG